MNQKNIFFLYVRGAAWLPRIIAAAILGITLPAFAEQEVAKGSKSTYVTDLTGTVSVPNLCQLENSLFLLERMSGKRVKALIVATTRPEDMETFSNRVAKEWGLTKEGEDAILLVASKEEMTLTIRQAETQGGLSANKLMKETVEPELRRGDIYGALRNAIEVIIKSVEGDSFQATTGGAREGRSFNGASFFVLLLLCLLGMLIRDEVGNLLTGGLTSAAAFAVIFLLSSLPAALILSSFLFVIVSFSRLSPDGGYRAVHSGLESRRGDDAYYGGISTKW